jgi:hypothetical protein
MLATLSAGDTAFHRAAVSPGSPRPQTRRIVAEMSLPGIALSQ